MKTPEFSPERRKFLRNSLEATAAVVLAPAEKVTRLFENKEEDLEQKHIKDCIAEYNKKYPEIKDKIREQKKWFLRYMDSDLYKKLLAKEMERALGVLAESSDSEKKTLKEFVNSELKDRKLKVKNIKFFIDHTIEGSIDAYTTILNINDISDLSRVEYLGNREDLPKEESFMGVVVNEIPFNSDCLNNFEGVSVFCHELHHISLTKIKSAETQPVKKTDDIFKDKLLQSSLDSTQVGSGKEAYVLSTAENMARIIAVRKTLFQLGKMKSFKDEFTEKHIEYIKKYLDDLFPKTSFIRYLFSGELKKENKAIDNQTLLELMNSFADVFESEDLNSRMS
ncbi:MAG: hypothetical protein KBC12_02165 [Candidatus Pacebacteria bacterium]|nr:hypothetical protein [Candidatus Paceibacterota bacterium]MBP9851227.1 hypothetical protein [Candidatus Paceibacterota bacterium]